jgi:hypothetical protein
VSGKEEEVASYRGKVVKGSAPLGGEGGAARPGELAPGSGGRMRSRKHPYEFRRRAVRLYLEDGIPIGLVAQELGISAKSVYLWTRCYRQVTV